MSNPIQLAILFVSGVVLIGVVLPFLLRDPKPAAVESHVAAEHKAPFTVFGYQIGFLVALIAIQVGIWYGLPHFGLRVELRKGVMLAAYIGQLVAWDAVLGWLYSVFGQHYHKLELSSDGGDDYADTAGYVMLWCCGVLLAIVVMAGFQWSDGELNWVRLFARAYFAPGITAWMLVGAHYSRIPKIWEGGVAAGLIALMVFPLAEYLRGCEPWGNLLTYNWWFPNVF